MTIAQEVLGKNEVAHGREALFCFRHFRPAVKEALQSRGVLFANFAVLQLALPKHFMIAFGCETKPLEQGHFCLPEIH